MNEELSILCNNIQTKVMFGDIDITNCVTEIHIKITPEGPSVILSVMPSVIDVKNVENENIKIIVNKEV